MSPDCTRSSKRNVKNCEGRLGCPRAALADTERLLGTEDGRLHTINVTPRPRVAGELESCLYTSLTTVLYTC